MYLQLKSYCKIDNLYTDQDKQTSPHFFLEKFALSKDDVIERLIRSN